MVRFLIVTTGYNCERYVKGCFDSIISQTYMRGHGFEHKWPVWVNDGSTDNTGLLLQKFGSIYEGFDFKNNTGTYYSRDFAINNTSHEYDVIALLDMDDQLLPHALETVAKEYESNPELLMTYGNYISQDGELCPLELEYSQEIHDNRDYRKDVFRCTHLRTFRKELYQAIPKWNPTKSEVQSYPDAELLFSMMEMSGQKRMKCIKEPIYRYQQYNPIRTLDRFGKDIEGYNEITQRPKREII